jgi:hypothetical protein
MPELDLAQKLEARNSNSNMITPSKSTKGVENISLIPVPIRITRQQVIALLP